MTGSVDQVLVQMKFLFCSMDVADIIHLFSAWNRIYFHLLDIDSIAFTCCRCILDYIIAKPFGSLGPLTTISVFLNEIVDRCLGRLSDNGVHLVTLFS